MPDEGTGRVAEIVDWLARDEPVIYDGVRLKRGFDDHVRDEIELINEPNASNSVDEE